MTSTTQRGHVQRELPDVEALRATTLLRLRAGNRFVGLFGSAPPTGDGPVLLNVVLMSAGGAEILQAEVGASYPCLSLDVAAAFWDERILHDLFGTVPAGHPRLDPLVLPLATPPDGPVSHPRPGAVAGPGHLTPDERAIPSHVSGPGLFTIPHGPVRSGVVESVEYLLETPGEDIPHLHVRIFAKHRGIERAFQGRTAGDGVLLAERVEGIFSVAHALAYCHALESAADIPVPGPAAAVRVLHAELERIVGHLDSIIKLCEAAGLAVAIARFSTHKERIMRLRSMLCGNRFGRGVVVPGGVRAFTLDPDLKLADQLEVLERAITADARVLMRTSSFLDRIRGTGTLSAEDARDQGALGPVARGSGYDDDARWARPYDGYDQLRRLPPHHDHDGDAQARTNARWREVADAFRLIRQVQPLLTPLRPDLDLRTPLPLLTGRGVGWAESAQGEVVYVVDLVDGRIVRCWPRAASLHNLALFHQVFHGDVFTDFAFIEASFALSIAGAVL